MLSIFGKPIMLPMKVNVPKNKIKNTPASILRLIRKLDDFWFITKIVVCLFFQNVYLVPNKKVNTKRLSLIVKIMCKVLYVSKLKVD